VNDLVRQGRYKLSYRHGPVVHYARAGVRVAESLRDVITVDPACDCPAAWREQVLRGPARALVDARTRGRTAGSWAVEVGALCYTPGETSEADMHIAVYMATLTAVLDASRVPHLCLDDGELWRVVWALT
jgi:hypothetical protein